MKRFSLALTLSLTAMLVACGEPPQIEEAATAIPDTSPITKAPVLAAIDDQSTNEDSVLTNVAVAVQDDDSNLDCQTALSASSGNVSLIKSSKVVFSGTSPSCLMTITPESNKHGTANIIVTATDGVHRVNTIVRVTVNPLNDPPTISAISAKTTESGVATSAIAFTIDDPDSNLDCSSSLTMTSSSSLLVPTSNVVFSGTAPNCSAVITPTVALTGSSNIGIVVTDGSLSATSSFTLNVVLANFAPTIGVIADKTTDEDTATSAISFSINDLDSTLSCASSVSMSSSDVSKIANNSIVFSGTAPNCSAVINPLANTFGTTPVTFTVTDGSKSASRTFNVHVNSVNDAPILSTVPTQDAAMGFNKSFNFTIGDHDNPLACSSSYLSITSSNQVLINNNDVTFSGTAPNCSATLSPNAGQQGSSQISLTLSDGEASDTKIFTFNVLGPIEISPASDDIEVGTQITFSGLGGSGTGYTFSILSGGGTINSSTGLFTAPLVPGTTVVRVTDSASNSASATITIFESIAISPITGMVIVNDTIQLTASGGVPPYSYSVSLGNGSVDSTGMFSAPPATGSSTVTVTDSKGNSASSSLTVVSVLTISPTSLTLPVFSTHTFLAAGGTSPYTFSVTAGTGSIDPATGILIAGSSVGSAIVTVADNGIQSKSSNVLYVKPVKISAGASHACAVYDNGGLKCWGLGTNGRLGNGSTASIGDNAGEVGGNVPFVDLGFGRTAIDVSAGNSHTCALLDNSTIKCWGSNTNGKLGYGDTNARGDDLNEMGDDLAAVALGTGRTAKAVIAGNENTCAILDNDSLKCWGGNANGQLGLGNTTSIIGDSINEMGTALAPVDLGTSKTVKKVALSKGSNTICAILNDNTLKCWGQNTYGQLGKNNTLVLGDQPNEMGDLLTTIFLGTGRTAVDISLGLGHACALLDNATIKCWGYNNVGQLGQNSTTTRGDSGTEMNSLVVSATGLTTPVAVMTGSSTSCAIASAGAVRCWGSGANGIRLSGGTTNVGKSSPNMSTLTDINFGGGIAPSKISIGYNFGCIIGNNDRIKCWGSAAGGVLLNGSTTSHAGDAAGEVGDAVSWLNH